MSTGSDQPARTRSAELIARDAVERLELAIASGEIATWEADTSNGDLIVDDRWAAIFGVAPGVVPFARLIELVHPDDRAYVSARVRASLSGPERGSYRAEYRILRPDGAIRWVSGRGSVFFGPSGRATRSLGILTDITAAKEAEQARERFLGVLGHDLKHPLAVISLSAAQLARTLAGDARTATAVDRITRASASMDRMIRDLLDLARGRSRALALTLAGADLAELCRSVVGEVEALHPERRIELAANGDLRGTWDGDRVAQALTNLLTNAVTHGIDPIRLRATGTADRVAVTVANGGAPIAPEEQASLFDPFQRGSGARGGGLGLGLYIVAEIAKAHGGSVRVASDEGSTAFTMEWPRRPPGAT